MRESLKTQKGGGQKSNNFTIFISEGKSKIPFGSKTKIAYLFVFFSVRLGFCSCRHLVYSGMTHFNKPLLMNGYQKGKNKQQWHTVMYSP